MMDRLDAAAASLLADRRWRGCGSLKNIGWTDEARASSLAVRRANAASRSTTGDASGEGGGREVKVSAINTSSNGKTYVGFTDYSVDPPKHLYIPVGGEDSGWSVKECDGGSAVLVDPDGNETKIDLGGKPAVPENEEGDGAAAAQGREEQTEGAERGDRIGKAAKEGDEAFYDTYGRHPERGDEFREAAELSGADPEDLDDVEEWIRTRSEDAEDDGSESTLGEDGDNGAPDPEPEGGDSGPGETPKADEIDVSVAASLADAVVADLNAGVDLEDTKYAFTEDLMKVCQGLIDRQEKGEKLSDHDAEVLAVGEKVDAALRKRREDATANREMRKARLRNRVSAAADIYLSGRASVLANIGWTDEARAAALAVRRANAAARPGATVPAGAAVRAPGGGGFVPPGRVGRYDGSLEGRTFYFNGIVYKITHGSLMKFANLPLESSSGGKKMIPGWGRYGDPNGPTPLTARFLDSLRAMGVEVSAAPKMTLSDNVFSFPQSGQVTIPRRRG